MGSTNVTPNVNPEATKTVVIVGFSYAGQNLIQAINSMDKYGVFKYIVVDKSDHFEHMPNNFESFVSGEAFLKQNTVTFDTLANNFDQMTGGRFEFKQGLLTEVLHDQNKIEISLAGGEKTETVDYDVLCICTGANYVGPWRAAHDQCDTLAGRNNEFSQAQQAIQAAKSVLCIGAGDTGVETAGWLKEAYPEKEIGMSMRGDTILKAIKGAHPLAEKNLKELGVQIHFNTPHSEGATVKCNATDDYEYYLDCSGFKFKGPTEYFKNSVDFLDKKSNQILVDIQGRVTNVHPIATVKDPKEAVVLKNVFSCGDVCLTPSNEVKSIVSMYQYIPVIAQNMLCVAMGNSPTLQIPKEFHIIQMIPIGTKRGFMVFNGMVSDKKDAWPEKCEIRDMTIGAANGDAKWIKKAQGNAKTMPKIFGLASGCCGCLPIHISKSRAATLEVQAKQKEQYDTIYNN